MNKLELPKNKRIKGLFIFCNGCKKKFSKPSTCNCSAEHQVYKAIITIPGTSKVKTKILNTRNLDEAIKYTLDFEHQLKIQNYHIPVMEAKNKAKPYDLIGCIAMFIDYLTDENVYEHQKRKRSKSHINQNICYLTRFTTALQSSGIGVRNLLVSDLSNEHVSIFYSYLIKENFANRTFNRHMDTVSEFLKYLIEIEHYDLVNHFDPKNAKRKRVNPKIESVSLKDFKVLLKTINPQNGTQVLSTGENKHLYYDWLKDSFELGLYTGRRRDEVVNMKFSDVFEQDGKPIYIKSEDYKYNLRNNLIKEEEKKYNYTPVIYDLNLFLKKIGYDKNKGTDRFLLAPESPLTRDTIKNIMSKAFSHYYAKLNTGKKLQYKHLRKTYITYLNHFTNGKAEVVTGHYGHNIIMKNYHDQTVFNNVLSGFRMTS